MAVGLVIVRGPGRGQTFTLGAEPVTIGRDAQALITAPAKLVIADASVSRRHARISQYGDVYALEDLGSTNGTFVNGARVAGPTPLLPGDLIELGTAVTLSFENLDLANVTMLALNQVKVEQAVDDIVQQEYFQQLKDRMKQLRQTPKAKPEAKPEGSQEE